VSQTALLLCATLLWGSLAAVVLAAPAMLSALLYDEIRSNRRHVDRR
jgi:hypothetical protein